MRKVFNLVVAVAFLATVAGLGWMAFGEVKASEALQFNESIDMVSHQTMRIDTSLRSTSSLVTTDISEIASIEQLMDEWTPRFERASLAYVRFDAAIVAAERQAEAYFAEQRALTSGYHDDELRARAEAADEAEYAIYGEWLDRAHRVRTSAKEVLDRLEDMNTELRKLKLTTEMSSAFNVAGFKEVPVEITSLGAELSEFQVASDNIRAITKSPFEEVMSQ